MAEGREDKRKPFSRDDSIGEIVGGRGWNSENWFSVWRGAWFGRGVGKVRSYACSHRKCDIVNVTL